MPQPTQFQRGSFRLVRSWQQHPGRSFLCTPSHNATSCYSGISPIKPNILYGPSLPRPRLSYYEHCSATHCCTTASHSPSSPPVIPLPHRQSTNAPRFDPENYSTLEVYLLDYELVAKAAHLTPAERLSQSTQYLGKQEKEDWESLPEFHAMPPDWDAFKEALFRDYPNARKPNISSAILDVFIEEKSWETIRLLTEFATFHWEFRRITGRLIKEGWSNPDELRKAYTKSININLCQKIQIYLKSEKVVPPIQGEAYSIEQVRAAAEYILEGSDPCFNDIITVHQLESSKRSHSSTVSP